MEKKVDVRKSKTVTKKKGVVDHSPLFYKENYLLMVLGAVVIGIGMFIMSGGKSADPAVFDYNEVYSKTRITVAPILIVLGLVIEVVAIFKKPKVAA